MINRILHSLSPHRRLVSKFSFEMTTCARSSIYYMCQLRLLLKIDKDNQKMTPSKKKQACRWCQVEGGGRVVRGVLLIGITVGQGPIVLAVGAGRGCLDIFFLSSITYLFLLLPSDID